MKSKLLQLFVEAASAQDNAMLRDLVQAVNLQHEIQRLQDQLRLKMERLCADPTTRRAEGRD